MDSRFRLIVITVAMVLILTTIFLISNNPRAVAIPPFQATAITTPIDEEPPIATPEVLITSAPSPTPGEFMIETPIPMPTLNHPLTSDEALVKALEIDANVARWEKSWSLETMNTEPDRIAINSYPDISYDGPVPDFGLEKEPVWVIKIKGDVQLDLPTAAALPHPTYDGVTYVIGQNTGTLLRITSGQIKQK